MDFNEDVRGSFLIVLFEVSACDMYAIFDPCYSTSVGFMKNRLSLGL